MDVQYWDRVEVHNLEHYYHLDYHQKCLVPGECHNVQFGCDCCLSSGGLVWRVDGTVSNWSDVVYLFSLKKIVLLVG